MGKYFSDKEFKNCSPSCSINDMDKEFMDKLDILREKAGIPLVITSAYRSREWDLSKGRSGNGAHTKGVAVDIRCNNSHNRFLILKACLEIGFKRIGIANTFIHVDDDSSLPQEVIWGY
jgi:hypothetical protein